MFQRKFLIGSILFLCISTSAWSTDPARFVAHIINAPVLEGFGIYSSIRVLHGNGNSVASAVTSLSILAFNGGSGVFNLYGHPSNPRLWRKLHTIAGYSIAGASLWLTISALSDNHVKARDKYMSSGFTALAVAPVFIFHF